MENTSHLAISFDPTLVAVSWLVALFAAYTAVSTVDLARQGRGVGWLMAGSFAFGVGVWAMHFVGMKAVSFGAPFSFDLGLTLLSVFGSGLGAFGAFTLVSRSTFGFGQLLLAGVSLGSGIGAMHYIGMAAMRGNFSQSYDLTMLGVSVVVAVAISTLGLSVISARFLERFAFRNFLVAGIVGAAIPLMHYVGMYAVKFSPLAEGATPMLHTSAFYDATLAINAFVVVAVVTMAVPLFATSLVQTSDSGSPEVES
ncbi:MAG: MHYT domain-containing protein [Meiothermus sp.]|nr:MHYT domain-containing protein [Meiothermus sp.]